MTSAFFGLDLATRALRTSQTLVEVANQNIANANTPGYSRQTADVTATAPWPIPVFNAAGTPGQMGTGVQVTQITRARDTFLDGQVRAQLSAQGRWDARKTALGAVESVVNEPSTTGLSEMMTKYFSAWQDVANSPSDASARASLIERGKALAAGLNNGVGQLQQQQSDLDHQVGLTVANVNDYASQIANINKQIGQVETAGMKANDLRDQRDQLLDKLSSLVKINTVEAADGQISVYAGNQQLVDRSVSNSLTASTPVGQQFSTITWPDGTQLQPGDGQLQGELEARDQLVGDRIKGLNDLAGRLISQVNSLHTSGTDLNGQPGIPFFTGTDANTIGVNATLDGPNGTNYVAAGRAYADNSTTPPTYTYAKGDSSNAVALAEMANSVASVDSTSGLGANGSVSGPPAMTTTGISVSGSVPSTTYSFAWDSTNNVLQVTSSPGGMTSTAQATLRPGPSGQVMTVDAGALGVRLTLNVPNGSSLNSALSGLNGQTVSTSPNPTTIGNQYSQFVASLGVDSNTAQGQVDNQQVLLDHLQQQQQSVSGVSLDEETAKLIQYQRSYQAAAHVMSVMDSLLDTLINHTGAGA